MAALDPNAAQAAMNSMVPGAGGGGGGGGMPSAAAESAVAANLIRAVPPTRVLVLLNMVTEAELMDPQEYEVGSSCLRVKVSALHPCFWGQLSWNLYEILMHY